MNYLWNKKRNGQQILISKEEYDHLPQPLKNKFSKSDESTPTHTLILHDAGFGDDYFLTDGSTSFLLGSMTGNVLAEDERKKEFELAV
jgi:hypothetical protein